jgi:hypothetical protein
MAEAGAFSRLHDRGSRTGRRGWQQLVQYRRSWSSWAQECFSWRMPATRVAGLAYSAARAEPTVLARVIASRPEARELRETINGAWLASGAFVEPGRAGLTQGRHHGSRQVAQAGERILP